MRSLVLVSVLLLTGCLGHTSDWRPARGSADLPSRRDAYRIKETDSTCERIGYVTHAKSIEEIGDVVADHGGSHYLVLDDYGNESVERDTTGSAVRWSALTTGNAHSSSRVVKHHEYMAEAYLCPGDATTSRD